MKRTLQIANIIGFILTLVVNYLSNALPINGKTAEELSNLYPNLFVPAPFTFAIWGVIYLLLIGFVVYQASDLFSSGKKKLPHVEKIGWLFFISCLLNAGWLLSWHYQLLPVSLIIMIGFLISLILIYQRLEIGVRPAESMKERLLVRLPFQIYLGWISIATIANATAVLVSFGFDGGEMAHVWAIVMISIGGLLGLLMLWRKWDIAYPLVLVWAFYGIISERMEMMDFGFMGVAIAALVCIGLIVIGVLIRSVQLLRRG